MEALSKFFNRLRRSDNSFKFNYPLALAYDSVTKQELWENFNIWLWDRFDLIKLSLILGLLCIICLSLNVILIRLKHNSVRLKRTLLIDFWNGLCIVMGCIFGLVYTNHEQSRFVCTEGNMNTFYCVALIFLVLPILSMLRLSVKYSNNSIRDNNSLKPKKFLCGSISLLIFTLSFTLIVPGGHEDAERICFKIYKFPIPFNLFLITFPSVPVLYELFKAEPELSIKAEETIYVHSSKEARLAIAFVSGSPWLIISVILIIFRSFHSDTTIFYLILYTLFLIINVILNFCHNEEEDPKHIII